MCTHKHSICKQLWYGMFQRNFFAKWVAYSNFTQKSQIIANISFDQIPNISEECQHWLSSGNNKVENKQTMTLCQSSINRTMTLEILILIIF